VQNHGQVSNRFKTALSPKNAVRNIKEQFKFDAILKDTFT